MKMNIFYLDSDPVVAANMMCDKHVVKMILESAQMLSTAHRVLDGDEYADKVGLYKLAHKNHPSTIWVRSSPLNYDWLWSHMKALMCEYTDRYNKHHATERLLESLAQLPSNSDWGMPFTDPPQCMPEQYKCKDPIKAYRNYYLGDKMYMAVWKYTEAPSWTIA
tara:strand:+ start:1454 stop:1945 length:492 start_codon:yes stop_codon:yes gene_type:complete